MGLKSGAGMWPIAVKVIWGSQAGGVGRDCTEHKWAEFVGADGAFGFKAKGCRGPNMRKRLQDQGEEPKPEELESSLGSVMNSVCCTECVI